jgi:hypothetical protein
MSAPAIEIPPVIAAVLSTAADKIDALPQKRVTGHVDVLPVIQEIAGPLAEEALAALDAHRCEIGVVDNALYRWTTPLPKFEVVAHLQGAAKAVSA